MARRSYPQSVPPPYADAGEYTRTTPPENSRPYQGDLLGSYGEERFGARSSAKTTDRMVDPWGMRPGAQPQRMNYRGRGPKGWKRTDESIRDRVCDLLDASPDVDAREIDVSVKDGEVTLKGHVENREAKRRAEDIVGDLPGVTDVHNRLLIDHRLFEATVSPS
ncbi:MAG: BON domain-containing protein [Bdellovibrionaceae bacterium]|nr:BON domain-containing protein [Pseudobdellovibrionaceae bacterium]